jgi:hypothetical protein
MVPAMCVILILLLLFSMSSLPTAYVSAESTTLSAQPPPVSLLRTVQITPDSQFLTGSFARINYVPANDRFVVTFGTKASTEPNASLGAGYAYKEYTLDMQEAGHTGILEWYPTADEAGDSASCMVNSTLYYAFVSQNPTDPYGWRLVKYDAANWTRLQETYVLLPNPNEGNTDPMVAYVDGQLDVSGQYNPSGIWQEGNSTRHHFFTANLQPINSIDLVDTPNICGASIVFVDGIYYYVSADFYSGNLVLMKYDSNWHYLGMKTVVHEAHWSQGLVCDGRYFFLAYLDTKERTPLTFFPVYPNVHLAVFDRDWNLMQDVGITNFTLSSDAKAGRPWVILHGNRLYVSYDIDTVNKTTEEEQRMWQAYVTIFEVSEVTQGGTLPWPVITVGVVGVAVVCVAYIGLKKSKRGV